MGREKKDGKEATSRGRRRKGDKRADARAKKSARRAPGTKDHVMRCAGPVLRAGYFGRDPIGEGPEARCHNVTFVSGSEPALAGERAGWNRDGLRAEYSKRATGAVPARRTRTRRIPLTG